MLDDFLEIFKHSFHKLSLVGVKYLGSKVSEDNRKYYQFIGKFEFSPPRQLFDSEVGENKPYILNEFRKLDINTSNCISRKFTRKIYFKDSKVKKVSFQYIFDVIPKNIVDFEFDERKGKIYLFVLGYGTN